MKASNDKKAIGIPNNIFCFNIFIHRARPGRAKVKKRFISSPNLRGLRVCPDLNGELRFWRAKLCHLTTDPDTLSLRLFMRRVLSAPIAEFFQFQLRLGDFF